MKPIQFGSAILACVIMAWSGFAWSQDDGLRTVKVERYGIMTRVPRAWRLIGWSHDEKAFLLGLPQDPGSSAGFVSCELGVAPESLDDFRKRIDESNERPPAADMTKRRLVENRIEPIDEVRYGKKLADQLQLRLTSVWEVTREMARSWEVTVRVVHEGTLYTFKLTSDEAHYDSYRLDFEDMLKACVFTTPETGLRKLPNSYWMQRDFRFAMQLPPGWKPAFGPSEKVLFFATGESHEVFSDNLIVLATPATPLDLAKLKESLPGDVTKLDPKAKVTCSIVPQGGAAALETVIHTERGPLKLTIVERRFGSPQRNYEVKFTCESAAYENAKEAIQKALDSFVEVIDATPQVET
ncbi:MAG: hypothetical protein JNM18_07050 [Planctomycetaceae bacterium]|nr:hypothetical protein [Planctomycetaceae bacterium]